MNCSCLIRSLHDISHDFSRSNLKTTLRGLIEQPKSDSQSRLFSNVNENVKNICYNHLIYEDPSNQQRMLSDFVSDEKLLHYVKICIPKSNEI